jgi:hypothetical protein
MATDARRAFDSEADGNWVMGGGRNVNVLAGHLRRAVVVQGQQVDVVGHHCSWSHVEAREWGDGAPLEGPLPVFNRGS